MKSLQANNPGDELNMPRSTDGHHNYSLKKLTMAQNRFDEETQKGTKSLY